MHTTPPLPRIRPGRFPARRCSRRRRPTARSSRRSRRNGSPPACKRSSRAAVASAPSCRRKRPPPRARSRRAPASVACVERRVAGPGAALRVGAASGPLAPAAGVVEAIERHGVDLVVTAVLVSHAWTARGAASACAVRANTGAALAVAGARDRREITAAAADRAPRTAMLGRGGGRAVGRAAERIEPAGQPGAAAPTGAARFVGTAAADPVAPTGLAGAAPRPAGARLAKHRAAASIGAAGRVAGAAVAVGPTGLTAPAAVGAAPGSADEPLAALAGLATVAALLIAAGPGLTAAAAAVDRVVAAVAHLVADGVVTGTLLAGEARAAVRVGRASGGERGAGAVLVATDQAGAAVAVLGAAAPRIRARAQTRRARQPRAAIGAGATGEVAISARGAHLVVAATGPRAAAARTGAGFAATPAGGGAAARVALETGAAGGAVADGPESATAGLTGGWTGSSVAGSTADELRAALAIPLAAFALAIASGRRADPSLATTRTTIAVHGAPVAVGAAARLADAVPTGESGAALDVGATGRTVPGAIAPSGRAEMRTTLPARRAGRLRLPACAGPTGNAGKCAYGDDEHEERVQRQHPRHSSTSRHHGIRVMLTARVS